eukprot:2185938-Prymnesium_polylepis.3
MRWRCKSLPHPAARPAPRTAHRRPPTRLLTVSHDRKEGAQGLNAIKGSAVRAAAAPERGRGRSVQGSTRRPNNRRAVSSPRSRCVEPPYTQSRMATPFRPVLSRTRTRTSPPAPTPPCPVSYTHLTLPTICSV